MRSFQQMASFGSQRSRIPTQKAIELHEMVNPARWCITFADLKFFQSEVHRVIQDGETFEENFEASYGPSIYAVNEHYIKPVTAAAGKMSWALMMNPEGLDCDLFITHAWQEDVFEFTDKVLTSWPWRARHAWCCMLANPQNLDIAALLQSPSSSPFAIALQSSKYMLVVPNRHKSVYTRLWCGYEAYLAFQSNKTIRTATPPIRRHVLFSWLRMLPALLVGVTLGIIFKAGRWENALQSLTTINLLALLASLVSQNCGHIRICLITNHLGLAGGTAAIFGRKIPHGLPLLPTTKALRAVTDGYARACVIGYFLLAEVDRVNWQTAKNEATQLRDQYEGSIRGASCSEVQDEEKIRHEIGDHVDEVDKVIQVLLNAGMTSDALRDASLQGVQLRQSGVVQWAIPVLALGPQLLLGCWHLGGYLFLLCLPDTPETQDDWLQPHWFILSLQAFSVLARLGFLILLVRGSVDERCFMLNSMAKTVAPLFFVELGLVKQQTLLCVALHSLYHLSFLMVLLFAALGIRGTLKLPCGRFLVELFVSRVMRCGCSSADPDLVDCQSDGTSEALGSSSDSDSSRSS